MRAAHLRRGGLQQGLLRPELLLQRAALLCERDRLRVVPGPPSLPDGRCSGVRRAGGSRRGDTSRLFSRNTKIVGPRMASIPNFAIARPAPKSPRSTFEVLLCGQEWSARQVPGRTRPGAPRGPARRAPPRPRVPWPAAAAPGPPCATSGAGGRLERSPKRRYPALRFSVASCWNLDAVDGLRCA